MQLAAFDYSFRTKYKFTATAITLTVHVRFFTPPFPQIDIIRAVVIVWRVRGKTIRSVLCNIVCNNCLQCDAHTYEQTNSSLDWVLSHWAHFTVLDSFLWSPYVIGQTIIFSCCGLFFFFFLSFFSSPNLSSRRLDVYHTSTHGVALVRI